MILMILMHMDSDAPALMMARNVQRIRPALTAVLHGHLYQAQAQSARAMAYKRPTTIHPSKPSTPKRSTLPTKKKSSIVTTKTSSANKESP